jgi:hypothetical protein
VLFGATRATRRDIPNRRRFGFSGGFEAIGPGFSDGWSGTVHSAKYLVERI